MQRKHIRVTIDAHGHPQLATNGNGYEVTGVSHHSPSERFYRTDGRGGRIYFKGLSDALEWAGQTPMIRANPDDPECGQRRINPKVWDVATPAEKHAILNPMFAGKLGAYKPGCKERLSDCLAFWVSQKTERDRTPGHISSVTRQFNCFSEAVGDKPVDRLTRKDFVRYESWLLANGKKFTNQWKQDRIGDLREVLKLCIGKSDFPIPAEVLLWLNVFDPTPHSPDQANSQPLPSTTFRELVALCDTHTMVLGKRAIDPVQLKAILYLTANCAFGNKDICRITTAYLHLDAELPYTDFPRQKVNWKMDVMLNA